MLKTLMVKSTLILLACSISFAAHAVADTRIRVDVPAGELLTALQLLGKQADIEFVYQAESVKGFRTGGVTGDFTLRDAVMKLLEGTPLQVRTDEASGALLITTPLPSDRQAPSGVENQPKDAARQDSAATREKRSLWNRFRLAQAETTPPTQGVRSESRNSERENPIVLDEIVVTGSRIAGRGKGVDVAGHKLSLDEHDLEAFGEASVPRALQKLPQVFGSQTEFAATDSFSGNQSFGTGVSLRGLGFDSTLVLVNGQRFARTGAGATFTDISAIPSFAIERVDVFLDGASAVYGADAIGGVVNIITKDKVEGIEGVARVSRSTDGGYGDERFALGGGMNWKSGGLLLGAEYFDHDGLLYADRDVDGDYRDLGGRDFRGVTANPANVRAVDGNLDALSDLAGTTVQSVALPPGQDGRSLVLEQLLTGINTDRRLFTSELGGFNPNVERLGGFAALRQAFGDDTDLNVTAIASASDSSMPFSLNTRRILAPAANPFNPFGEDVFVDYAFTELGPLAFDISTDTYNADAAFVHRIERWGLHALASYGKEDFSQTFAPFIKSTVLNQLVQQTDPSTAFTPFGDGSGNTAATLSQIVGSQVLTGTSDGYGVEAFAEGTILDRKHASLKAAAGVQYREESFESVTSQDFLSPPVFRVLARDRDVMAGFAELNVDLWKRDTYSLVSASGAVRFEDYSDFGENTSPRFGLILRPMRSLKFHATWGRSFKAPLLRQLAAQPLALMTTVFDPRRNETRTANFVAGTTALGPETADSFSVGVSARMANGLAAFDINYFNIDYRDRVVSPSSATIVSNEALFPGLVTRGPQTAEDVALGRPGPIVSIDGRLRNLAVLNTDGLDLSASLRPDTSLGDFAFTIAATVTLSFETQASALAPAFDAAGRLGNPPDYRVRGGVSWTHATDRVSANVFANYTPAYLDSLAPTAGEVDSYTTLDAALSVRADELSEGLMFTLGGTNLLDRSPPFVATSPFAFDPLMADPAGRVIYANALVRF